MKIFLSASVPLPKRNPVFLKTADVFAIREAVKGLILVLIERKGNLVFGGHPAITPLIRLLFDEAKLSPRDYITLYQSRYFANEFPPDNAAFERCIPVEAIDNDREKSLLAMRRKMIGEEGYTHGIFIGGMEGVLEEFAIFQNLQPASKAFPIASTGAAALQIYDNFNFDNPPLKTEFTYPTLFRKRVMPES